MCLKNQIFVIFNLHTELSISHEHSTNWNAASHRSSLVTEKMQQYIISYLLVFKEVSYYFE